MVTSSKKIIKGFLYLLEYIFFIEHQRLHFPHQIVIMNFNYLIMLFSDKGLQKIIEIPSVDKNNFMRTT